MVLAQGKHGVQTIVQTVGDSGNSWIGVYWREMKVRCDFHGNRQGRWRWGGVVFMEYLIKLDCFHRVSVTHQL